MDNNIQIHHIAPVALTPEEQHRGDVVIAELRALKEAMEREAIAGVKCPRCKVGPGEECVWRIRHSERVHDPRLYRTPTWKAWRR